MKLKLRLARFKTSEMGVLLYLHCAKTQHSQN